MFSALLGYQDTTGQRWRAPTVKGFASHLRSCDFHSMGGRRYHGFQSKCYDHTHIEKDHSGCAVENGIQNEKDDTGSLHTGNIYKIQRALWFRFPHCFSSQSTFTSNFRLYQTPEITRRGIIPNSIWSRTLVEQSQAICPESQSWLTMILG